MKQITQIFLEGERPTLKNEMIHFFSFFPLTCLDVLVFVLLLYCVPRKRKDIERKNH